MANFTVSVDLDLRDVTTVKHNVRRLARLAVRDAAEYLLDEAIDRCPIGDGPGHPRYGKLIESLGIVYEDDGMRAIVGSPSPVALYVEYGTNPHPIEPVNYEWLRFMWNGEIVFAKHVDHPGEKPQPFLTPAADDARGEMLRIFEDKLREIERRKAARRRR